jgi:phosphoribosylaminoimidazole-succinocarboxamide synthase
VGPWGGWKPAWIEDLQETVHASALLFKLLDMWGFWTTMAARFREQAAANCFRSLEETKSASSLSALFPKRFSLATNRLMSTSSVQLQAALPRLKLFGRGKVRDIYAVGDELLIVASDRISAFDFILGSGIPLKGKVLTQISLFWFEMMKDIIPNHLISASTSDYPIELGEYAPLLEGRSMLVKKAQPFPVECVARGYLAGSGWKEYQQQTSVCDIALPKGLVESSRLPEPIFTPATKASSGHDINIPFDQMSRLVGSDIAQRLRETTLRIYRKASAYAASRGIIIADTKLEFGVYGGEIILIDELLTPDSSRFWPDDAYAEGRPQDSFDKQFVRDYLEASGWNKQPPAPALPDRVVLGTSAKYIEAYERLTGMKMT